MKEGIIHLGKERKHKIHALKESQIDLWLDDYDDLFSDFDPRQFSRRALSDDFLLEAKKASADKNSGKIKMSFMVPAKLRNKHDEVHIARRLRQHFDKHYGLAAKEMNSVRNKGFSFIFLGLVFMIFATILHTYFQVNFFISLLIIIFEPGGWFCFWEGLSLVVFETKTLEPDKEFYRKMSRARIEFSSY